jgi:transcriptional regulator with PAS, ATPase and Fis domain
VSPAQGTVFLDEIGELDPVIQVKLLRVLQSRVFQRLGETEDRVFRGKIVAATNQNLARMMAEGRFRRDFYFRLCADMIRTPSLREQLADAPGSLAVLVRHLTLRLIGEEEADALAAEVVERIAERLGPDYGWPGNVRELEQCIRAIIIRRDYQPDAELEVADRNDLFPGIEAGAMSADELMGRYFTLVYAKSGSYQEAARRLGVDHRTVKAKIDEALLERIRRESQNGSIGGEGQA